MIQNLEYIVATHMDTSNMVEKGGEPFTEPHLRPPVGRDQVTKPLVGQLVGRQQC